MLVKKQYKKKYIGKNNISRGNWIGIKPKNFAVYIHEKNNIFLAKIVEYNVFLATSFATSIFVF